MITRGCGELLNELPLSHRCRAKLARVPASGQQLFLRSLELAAGRKQLRDRFSMSSDQLIDRPGRDGRLTQRGDLLGLPASPRAAKLLRQGSSRWHELLERQAIQIVWAPDGHAKRS